MADVTGVAALLTIAISFGYGPLIVAWALGSVVASLIVAGLLFAGNRSGDGWDAARKFEQKWK